jgi:hypothetical protein
MCHILIVDHPLGCLLLCVTQIINIVESGMSYVKLVILGFKLEFVMVIDAQYANTLHMYHVVGLG